MVRSSHGCSLIESKAIDDLHGFFSRTGEEYAASVTLSDAGKVTTKGNGAGSVEITDEPIASCPVCESGTVRQGHDGYACDSEECTFRGIRAEMCQRPITVEEARAILTEGRSALLEGFILVVENLQRLPCSEREENRLRLPPAAGRC